MTRTFVSGPFDDIRSGDLRFLEEAARSGALTVALWPDDLVARVRGGCRFPLEERRYVLESVRFVERVIVSHDATPDLSGFAGGDAVWAVREDEATPGAAETARRGACSSASSGRRNWPASPLRRLISRPSPRRAAASS